MIGKMLFRVLGDIEAFADGNAIDLGHAKQRHVLAALLIDSNHPVLGEALLDRVWADRLPQRAREALSSYVSRLRQLLSATGMVSLERRPGGYSIVCDPMDIDVHRFRHLVSQAHTADDQTASRLLEEALGLWRGEPLATLDTPWAGMVRDSLLAERHAAELRRNDLALAAGRHSALVSHLVERAVANPLDERLAGQLLLALYRCGRQAEALQHYEQLRRRLADELGTDPTPALQLLHKQILTTDPVLAGHEPSSQAVVPRQLPARPRTFTGRARELARLNESLTGETPTTVVISAFSGMAGIGKTALAIHWAHEIAARFPDGQLFVNLRGFDPSGQPMSPAEAIRGFLDALDVPTSQVPSNLDAQTGLYRSLLSGRRMLIVLDNARDVEQVRPLLPGSAGCLVIVTSRNQLTGLIAGEGARPLALDPLDAADARDLLARHLGAERIAAEPEATSEIVARCGRLPLALSIVAARAASHPGFALSISAAELQDSLDTLADPDLAVDIRAVFSWSYDALGAEAARLFRLLGLHCGPDISAAAAASLAGLPPSQTRLLLGELARAHLVTEHRPGRYTMHDLIRAYAAEQAGECDSEPERNQAMLRVLDHYAHTAYQADGILNPYRERIAPPAASPGVVPEHPSDMDSAMAWLRAEHRVLLAALEHASHAGFDTHAYLLPMGFASFLGRRGHWHELAASQRQALDAALRLADRSAQAYAHRGLARAYIRLQRFKDAFIHLGQSLELFGSLGNRGDVAWTQLNVAWALGQQDRHREAIAAALEALDLYRALGDPTGQANALSSLGWYHTQIGDHQEAIAHCERALTHFREIGDRRGEAATLDSLGHAHRSLNQHQQAISYYEQALARYRDGEDDYNVALVLDYLGDAYHAGGAADAARRAWQRALDVLDKFDQSSAEKIRSKLAMPARHIAL